MDIEYLLEDENNLDREKVAEWLNDLPSIPWQTIYDLSEDFAEAYVAWASGILNEMKFPNRIKFFINHFVKHFGQPSTLPIDD